MTFSAMQWYQAKQLTRADYNSYLAQRDKVERSRTELIQTQAQCQTACQQVVLDLRLMLSTHPATDRLFYSMGNISHDTPVKSLLIELAGLTGAQFNPQGLKSQLTYCWQRYTQNALVYGSEQFSERGMRAHSIVEAGKEVGIQLRNDLASFYQRLDQIQALRDVKKKELDEAQETLQANRPSSILTKAYHSSLNTALEQLELYARKNHILGIPSLCAKLRGTEAAGLTSSFLEQEIATYKTLPQGPILKDDSTAALLLKELRALIKQYEQDINLALSPSFDKEWLQAMAASVELSQAESAVLSSESKTHPSESKPLPNPIRAPDNTPKPITSNFQLNCLFGLSGSCILTSVVLFLAIAFGATASAIPIVATGLAVGGLGMLAFAFFKQCKPSEATAFSHPLPANH